MFCCWLPLLYVVALRTERPPQLLQFLQLVLPLSNTHNTKASDDVFLEDGRGVTALVCLAAFCKAALLMRDAL
jgi:hypothetical protein